MSLKTVIENNVFHDPIAEIFKPKTELVKRFLELRQAYVKNGGKLLDTHELELEMRVRRGGLSNG